MMLLLLGRIMVGCLHIWEQLFKKKHKYCMLWINALNNCSIEKKEMRYWYMHEFWKSKWWDENCDWYYRLRNNWINNLVLKEYKKNSVEILLTHTHTYI